jgi:hypothetical protein
MGFFEQIFGTDLAARVALAVLLILVLAALTVWLIRRFGAVTLTRSGGARGRQPRLAVLEWTQVDARRRLVLIRRDNVEHLVLVGGPTDVVVEPNIVRAAPLAVPAAAPSAPAGREPIARAAGRAAPLEVAGDESETPLVPAAPEPVAPKVETARETATSTEPQPEPRPASRFDSQYAEMAQRLEAALRRAPAAPRPEPRPEPKAEPRLEVKPEPRVEVKPEPRIAPSAPAHPSALQRVEPKVEAPKPAPEPPAAVPPRAPEPRMPRAATPPPPAAAAPTPPPAPTPPAPKPAPKQDVFANLEEEMANLLGRGTGKQN